MQNIFLSYRREDSAYATQALFDRLESRFGTANVFMDVHRIPCGADFRQQLIEGVRHCEAFVPVIGDHWLTAKFSDGRRRLDDPRDFVRIELEAAMNCHASVLPVLVGQAPMPREEELPDPLRPFAYYQATRVSPGRDFYHHVDALARAIESIPKKTPSEGTMSAPRLPTATRSFIPDRYSVLARGGDYFTNSVDMRLRIVPAGEFLMGSPDWDEDADRDEKPPHPVRITHPFLIGVYCVTQEQFELVCGTNYRLHATVERHPVVHVSWVDAADFCNRLSEWEGLTPCYELAAGEVRIVSDEGYRLPTEAEWEYACRAGSTTKWCCGNDKSALTQFACVESDTVRPVGTKSPNAWGLYDMHGNVWEWCWDWFAPGYPLPGNVPLEDPRGPPTGEDRVVRGGSYYFQAWNARSAYRIGEHPLTRSDNIGFRIARSLPNVARGLEH